MTKTIEEIEQELQQVETEVAELKAEETATEAPAQAEPLPDTKTTQPEVAAAPESPAEQPAVSDPAPTSDAADQPDRVSGAPDTVTHEEAPVIVEADHQEEAPASSLSLFDGIKAQFEIFAKAAYGDSATVVETAAALDVMVDGDAVCTLYHRP